MITRYRGDTKPLVVTLSSSEGPLDLTGCTTFMLTADPSKDPTSAATNIFALTGFNPRPASMPGDPNAFA